MKPWTRLKMGHVGSNTRSLDQMLEIPYVCSRGDIFCLIIMKLDQHVCIDEVLHKVENGSCLVKARSQGEKLGQYRCLDKISDKFQNGSCQVKNYVTRSNLRKSLCTL